MRLTKPLAIAFVVIALVPQLASSAETWSQLLARADSLFSKGNYDSAIAIGNLALEKTQAEFGVEDTASAKVLHRLGTSYWQAVDYAPADSLLRRALAIREKLLGPDHLDVGRTLNNLAGLYLAQSRYAEAAPLFQRAAQILEKALGTDDPVVGTALDNLALLFRTTGRYREAETYGMRALAIQEKTLGPDHPVVATCLRHLATVYRKTGRFSEAEACARRALAINEKKYGSDSPKVAPSLLELGTIYDEVGAYPAAESLLVRALALREKALGPDHIELASTVGSLAEVYMRSGRFAEAEPLYRRALGIREKAKGPDYPDLAWELDGLGTLHVRRHQLAEAEPFYQRSLAVVEKTFSPEAWEVVLSQDALARLYYLEGRFTDAESLFRRACDGSRKAFVENAAGLSERDALTYSQFIKSAGDHYLSCLVRSPSRDSRPSTAAAEVILSGKGQVSDEMFERQRATVQETDSNTVALAESLRYTRFQLSQLFVSSPDSDLTAYRQKVDSLSDAADNLEGELSRRSASYRQQKDRQHVTAQRVASLLPKNSVLVEYVKYDCLQLEPDAPDSSIPHYLALVMKGSGKPFVVDLGEASVIDRLVGEYRQHMQGVAAAGRMPSPVDLAQYQRVSEKIYATTWQPMAKAVAGSKLVCIAGDGALNRISFAGLRTPNGRYLIEDYPIHYLSSGRDLIRLNDEPPSARGLLAMGDPDFDAPALSRISGTLPAQQANAAPISYAVRNVRSGCGSLRETKAQAIPGTRTEVQQIVARWEQASVEPVAVYYGPQASEDNFKKSAPGARVVHLATHGYFLEGACQPQRRRLGRGEDQGFVGENPLLLSGLLFAGANLHGEGADSAQVDDGILTAYEVSGLDLAGTELVVLSACETGLGEAKAGEGVYGLRRAFQMAGARTVISSLWPVPDQATAEVMSQLYGQSKASLPERLRNLQLAQIKKLRESGSADHPYSWAAFIALGDWR